jgi:hypothetical protein
MEAVVLGSMLKNIKSPVNKTPMAANIPSAIMGSLPLGFRSCFGTPMS